MKRKGDISRQKTPERSLGPRSGVLHVQSIRLAFFRASTMMGISRIWMMMPGMALRNAPAMKAAQLQRSPDSPDSITRTMPQTTRPVSMAAIRDT